ncbi:gluconokinase [Kaistia dalseonensis]|uniref:Gluconokinase n=1 Tax=Kaistia dalseonensis TaxID=410840 RepID=A0ABU0HB66_9HYPH|nr:gluconokinase [Kaistia dalseonensis]MCX5496394.1 gluconokinase [Kaistia dalseonensis]MDQ0439015.1 gluconokinase [Kaistia dalseonensis]
MTADAASPAGAQEPLAFNLVVMGVSGSGKSTAGAALADRFDTDFIEGDQLHPAANVAKMAAGTPLDDNDRLPWLKAIGRRMAEADDAAKGIVVACSSLKRSYRDILRAATRRPVIFIFLDGSHALLKERMLTRTSHFMPPSLLDSQLATLERPTEDEDFIRIDLDGDIDAELEAAADAIAARPLAG